MSIYINTYGTYDLVIKSFERTFQWNESCPIRRPSYTSLVWRNEFRQKEVDSRVPFIFTVERNTKQNRLVWVMTCKTPPHPIRRRKLVCRDTTLSTCGHRLRPFRSVDLVCLRSQGIPSLLPSDVSRSLRPWDVRFTFDIYKHSVSSFQKRINTSS